MASLRIGAGLDALSPIGAFVAKAADEAGIDKRAAYRLRVAVDEIATNIVLHGRPHQHGGDPMIDVETIIDDAHLMVVLEDGGPAFDPLAHAIPQEDDLTRPVHERPIGGLGVFLAIRGVDQFRYERTATRNRNVFIVNRKPAPDAASAPLSPHT